MPKLHPLYNHGFEIGAVHHLVIYRTLQQTTSVNVKLYSNDTLPK
jgi:hypothetical protein